MQKWLTEGKTTLLIIYACQELYAWGRDDSRVWNV